MTADSPALSAAFAEAFPELCNDDGPTPVHRPTTVIANHPLARELGVPDGWLDDHGAHVLGGNTIIPGSSPVAQAYSGHQFGNFVPLLGDGRACLLGEITTPTGQLVDIALKGSGRTLFSRGGDGRCALGPALREYLVSEAMAALGVPTTRCLAVVATGEDVHRDTPLAGAVVTRTAASHLRVGTFQFAAGAGGDKLVGRLARYAMTRHYPGHIEDDAPLSVVAPALLQAVADAQAHLVAQWMAHGFIHGVMNTDNCTISGETIDYGPCAFLEEYNPSAVFSSIDTGGRYAFNNQPRIAAWNMARLAETLVPLFEEEPNAAIERAMGIVTGTVTTHETALRALHARKLGLDGRADEEAVASLIDDLLALMTMESADFTSVWRALAADLRDHSTTMNGLLGAGAASWVGRWIDCLGASSDADRARIADTMDAVNPVYIPRNHLVEQALDAAYNDDLAPFTALLDAVTNPYTEHDAHATCAVTAPAGFTDTYATYCGT